MKLSESYNSLKLRNVKITLKTQKFQQHGSHVTFTYNFKLLQIKWQHYADQERILITYGVKLNVATIGEDSLVKTAVEFCNRW